MYRQFGDDDGHQDEDGDEDGQLDAAPAQLGLAALAQLALDGAGVVAEEAEEDVAPGVLGLAVVAVAVDGEPVDGVAIVAGAV
jgi:hypothetical protein